MAFKPSSREQAAGSNPLLVPVFSASDFFQSFIGGAPCWPRCVQHGEWLIAQLDHLRARRDIEEL
jgi:hypothetical protein